MLPVQDIRYAEKDAPTLPARKSEHQLVLMAVGQPETGRSTTLCNLFASFAKSASFQLQDVTGLSLQDFKDNPGEWMTEVHCSDSSDKHTLTFKIMVRASATACGHQH